MPPKIVNNPTRINKTAANWALDSTVYPSTKILVTTDVFYLDTDQPKIKLADGVQTWAQLDYMPIGALTLAQVLANGALTNGVEITSNDGFKRMLLSNTLAYLKRIDGDAYATFLAGNGVATVTGGDDNTTSHTVTVNEDYVELGGDLLTKLNTQNVELTQETASLILSTDASKQIKGLATSTYPSLTELSYVKGATSSIQTQLDAKTSLEIMAGSTTVFSPLDSTTTYISCITTLSPNVSAAARPIEGINGVVGGFWVLVDPTTTLGSNEDVIFNLYNITEALVVGELGRISFDKRGRAKLVTGLNLTTSTTKDYSVQMVNPAFGTNPTNVALVCKLLYK